MQGGIGDWIVRRARRKPTATALVDGDTGRRMSYDELERSSAATAHALHDLGIRRGDRVVVLMENSIGFMQVVFAVANLGAVSVPVNVRLGASEIGYILSDSGATAIAVSERFRTLADAALGTGGHGVRHVLVDGPPEPTGGVPTTELTASAAGPSLRPPDGAIRDDDLCMIMYTSGTTGRPKGAMLTHGNMLWNAINCTTIGTGLSGASVTLAVAPMFHIGALGNSVLPFLYAGATVVTVRAFEPRRTLELLAEHRVTSQFMVPAMWAALSQVPDFDSVDVSSMQFVLCGGAPCPLPVIDFYRSRGWRFLEGFGMTETAPCALLLDADFVVSHAGSVGRPFMHVDVRLVDDEDHDVPVGEVGELVLRGPNVFAGYWGRPADTAEAMRGGWFHSGDLGRSDADGFVTLVDRKKDMVISGGENIYPIEVEQVLFGHPAVLDVAVIGTPDERWGESVLAVVVLRPGTDAAPADLIDHARGRIAHYKCPRRVEFVDELPRTATGKVLKRDLRERYAGAAESVHR
ncbi:acyl-CoA synthetase [Pseudonocardia endophytica]|uniref:Fatty-acyl-CoA synthase n=1 Tax=Pseudonocardia endophytica TaxID=401976 RepID=A0A4R1HMJ1_PSEEN|nr:long-chain fatty acid--CoA ligase [Pseudonocardia endophytica]TCK22263.1 fatty-acyl-CoA synthase [Pseudonocardia endophytica]